MQSQWLHLKTVFIASQQAIVEIFKHIKIATRDEEDQDNSLGCITDEAKYVIHLFFSWIFHDDQQTAILRWTTLGQYFQPILSLQPSAENKMKLADLSTGDVRVISENEKLYCKI